MARLLLCTLCDDVRFEVGNKHTLVGLFDTFNVGDFAQPLPTFRVFAKLGLERPGPHEVVLRLASAEGSFRVEIKGQVDARAPSEVSGLYESVFTTTFTAIHIPLPGRYAAELAVDGEELGGCPFLALQATRPTLQ